MSERISALEMAVGFEARVYDRGQLDDWVEAEVLACDRVEGPLLELTMLRDKSDHAIMEDLRELAGVRGAVEARLFLACLGQMVEAGRIDVWSAFAQLYHLLRDGEELTEDECRELLRIEHDPKLTTLWTNRPVDQVRADFLAFTSQYRHLLAGVR
jgi:hypothetical protein